MDEKPSWTVYGLFQPDNPRFDSEQEAIECAQAGVNDWARDVVVVRSEVVWRSR